MGRLRRYFKKQVEAAERIESIFSIATLSSVVITMILIVIFRIFLSILVFSTAYMLIMILACFVTAVICVVGAIVVKKIGRKSLYGILGLVWFAGFFYMCYIVSLALRLSNQ